MKISKIHQHFAKQTINQRALEHPEEFLGPNWREVLNFWTYLSSPNIKTFFLSRTNTTDLDTQTAIDASSFTISRFTSSSVFWSVHDSTDYGCAEAYATLELIGAHKILEQGKSLKIVPLFLDS